MAGTQYTGNAIPAPGNVAGPSTGEDLEVLYSMVGYVQKGVTLKQGQGVLPTGTFLRQDAATKKYIKATAAGTVEGVLRKTVDTGTDSGAAAQVWLGNILYGGTLKLSVVASANSGMTLTSVLNAQVNQVQGFFRF
jgi:hypothetical protein